MKFLITNCSLQPKKFGCSQLPARQYKWLPHHLKMSPEVQQQPWYIKTCGISLSSNNLQDNSFLYMSCYRFSTSAMISFNNFLNRPFLQERVHPILTITQNQILPIRSHDKPYLCLAAACWLKADSVVNVLHKFYHKHYIFNIQPKRNQFSSNQLSGVPGNE